MEFKEPFLNGFFFTRSSLNSHKTRHQNDQARLYEEVSIPVLFTEIKEMLRKLLNDLEGFIHQLFHMF